MTSRPIAVGFDGSEQSHRALELAAREARIRSRPLRVLFAAPIPAMAAPHSAAWYAVEQDSPTSDVDTVTAAAKAAVEKLPFEITYSIETTDAISEAGALIGQSGRFDLLVVGTRGRGGFKELLLGSTSAQVAAHAHCPVIVTRERASEGPHQGAVVVGVDGTRHPIRDMLNFAFEAASVRGSELVAVHAWNSQLEGGDERQEVNAELDAAARVESETLSNLLAHWRQRFPDVPVSPHSEHGSPRQVLLERAAGCDLLVVGSHGAGPTRAWLLGSTSQAMIHHAPAPVAVVHDR